jgi:hypothetical protein
MIDFWFSTILGLLIIANIVMSFRESNGSALCGWGTALLLILMIIGRNV